MKKYEVMVSKRVRLDQNMPGHILTLTDRTIFRPEEENFWPGQENLKWHRDKMFSI
jgi:putative restriction endonuclease